MPPSMQWCSAQAATQGIDVLWWTDLLGLLEQSSDLVIPLTHGRLDPETLDVIQMPGGPDAITSLEAQIQGGKPTAQLQNGWLRMSLTSDLEAEEFQSFSYAPRSTRGKLRGFRFSRPLASRPQWHMKVEVPLLAPSDMEVHGSAVRWGENVAFEIDFYLSAHGQEIPFLHRLTYLLVPPERVKEPWIDQDAHVFIPVALSPGVNELTLDLAADAQYLPNGEDNVISDLAVTVRARKGATADLRWGQPRLASQRTEREELWAAIQDYAIRYQQIYGISQAVGGMYDRNIPTALGAFLPPGVGSPKPPFDPLPPAQWVAEVHSAQGLVSCHLGRNPGGKVPPDIPGAFEQRTQALRWATALLQTQAYSADLLAFEVNSPTGLELPSQLAIWDILLANGLKIGGVGVPSPAGVTVSGDPASQLEEPSPYPESPTLGPASGLVSWFWASEATTRKLWAALRDRRLFFGDPTRWQGPLDLRLTDRLGQKEYGRMGQTVTVPAPEAFLHLEGLPPRKSQVKVIQGLLRPGRSVHYVRREGIEEPSQATPLDTQQACFVRIEIEDEAGPMVCSNPIIIHKPH